MYSKSRDIRAACDASAPSNLSNNKLHRTRFLKDYYKQIKPYLNNPFSDEISNPCGIDELLSVAGEEFNNSYGEFPTSAVYAPGCLAMAGKSTGLAESKSLSMAIQLVTLIVGKRSHDSKWCHVKTLSDEIAGDKTVSFYLSSENLDLSVKEEASWIRYIKATIQSFKAKRVYVPGFEIVIASTVPVKRGLGSSSALVVALYTFLEVITSTYTGNVLEKSLACHLAEKLAVGSCGPRLVDTLTSVIGNEDKILVSDARLLSIDEVDWNPIDVELILIECPNAEIDRLTGFCSDVMRYKTVMIITNALSRWRTLPDVTSMMARIFPEETMNMVGDVMNEDERISRMIRTIEMQRWDKLGKLLWENYHSARKYMKSLPDDIKRIMTALETTEGVLGAGIISRGYGASIVTLVQRSRSETFISLLNRMKISKQRCYKIESDVGASVLYTCERPSFSWNGPENRRAKLMTKYHLHGGRRYSLKLMTNYHSLESLHSQDNFKNPKVMMLFKSRTSDLF